MTSATATIDRPAPTSTGEAAAALQPARIQRRPALPGLTGIRTLLALFIMLFHFTPSGLRWDAHPWVSLYPLVDIGYVFVSFFFLISGFILTYNYASRPQPINSVDFWMARFSRLYPVYILTLLISIPFLFIEFHARSHTQFWEGAILTPLLLQGCFPMLATFWNTVTWTLSCEVMLYLAFPFLIRLRWPRSIRKLVLMFFAIWIVGLIPHSVYILHNPDHLNHIANRYDNAFWINTLKYTPLPYICTFLAGITLAHLHEALKFNNRGRTVIGTLGFLGAWFATYHLQHQLPYIMIHGGLLTPIFGAIILGLSGPGILARIFSTPPLVTIGASTYCLYLLHFNLFILIHDHHLPELLHVERFDPWISFIAIILFCVGVRKFVEHPCQIAIGNWWKRKRAALQERRPANAR